jgi:hypothetical protein
MTARAMWPGPGPRYNFELLRVIGGSDLIHGAKLIADDQLQCSGEPDQWKRISPYDCQHHNSIGPFETLGSTDMKAIGLNDLVERVHTLQRTARHLKHYRLSGHVFGRKLQIGRVVRQDGCDCGDKLRIS